MASTCSFRAPPRLPVMAPGTPVRQLLAIPRRAPRNSISSGVVQNQVVRSPRPYYSLLGRAGPGSAEGAPDQSRASSFHPERDISRRYRHGASGRTGMMVTLRDRPPPGPGNRKTRRAQIWPVVQQTVGIANRPSVGRHRRAGHHPRENSGPPRHPGPGASGGEETSNTKPSSPAHPRCGQFGIPRPAPSVRRQQWCHGHRRPISVLPRWGTASRPSPRRTDRRPDRS